MHIIKSAFFFSLSFQDLLAEKDKRIFSFFSFANVLHYSIVEKIWTFFSDSTLPSKRTINSVDTIIITKKSRDKTRVPKWTVHTFLLLFILRSRPHLTSDSACLVFKFSTYFVHLCTYSICTHFAKRVQIEAEKREQFHFSDKYFLFWHGNSCSKRATQSLRNSYECHELWKCFVFVDSKEAGIKVREKSRRATITFRIVKLEEQICWSELFRERSNDFQDIISKGQILEQSGNRNSVATYLVFGLIA